MIKNNRVPYAMTKKIIQNFDNVLFDCDGVLWDGNVLIDGAKDLLQKLKHLGKNVFLVTNNSIKSRVEYMEKCKTLGLSVNEEQIISSSYVAAEYLKDSGFKGKLYVVGPKGLYDELDRVGIPHNLQNSDPSSADWSNYDFTKMELDPEVKGVIVGFDKNISYYKMMKAASYICQGLPFYATNTDSQLPLPNSPLVQPGTGCLIQAIAVGSGVDPIIMGKPHRPMFEVLLKHHNLTPEKSLMVGDRLETDILFGNNFGMSTLVVMTGITTPQLLEKTVAGKDNSLIPHYQMNSVKDVVQLLS